MKFINQVVHVGIIHPMIFPETGRGEGPILETVAKIVNDEFFGAIEVSWIKSEDVRMKVARLLAESHLDIIYSGAPPTLNQKVDLNNLNEAVRRESINLAKKMVDEAIYINARICTLLSGPKPVATEKERATKLLSESLIEICDYAKSKGNLMITLEGFDSEYEKRCLIGPTGEAAALANVVRKNCKNFGLTIDLSHLPLLHEKPEAVAKAGEYLESTHIGNCIIKDKSTPAYGDQHPRFGAPNSENDVPELAAFLKTLARMGFFMKKTATSKPVISFEVKPQPDESSDAIIANSKRTLLDAWAMLD
jgi:sugar phosphate isomerase/epimerase